MEKFKFLSKNKINTLSETAGVYCFKKNGKIIYIGKALNIRERIKQHQELLNQVKQLGYIETGSEIDALLLEARLIKKYQPKYNVTWKDDKNYFYVAITNNHFPRVIITHQPQKIRSTKHEIRNKSKILNSKYRKTVSDFEFRNSDFTYIGPFIDGRTLKQTLKILRKAFPYYTQKKHPDKLCPWCHLNLCPGPPPKDLGEVHSRNERQSFIKEYRKNIRKLIAVLEEKRKLQEKPIRMEGYDISNIQGQFATGSMVTFVNGEPDKNFYRRFKIKIGGKPNDVAMLKEVLTRRFNHPEWPYPDLILIDGGKAQLNAGSEILNQHKSAKSVLIRVLALAKRHNELFLENRKKPILLDSLTDSQKFLLLRLRDEAHRFAISYHRKLRVKSLIRG